jgi:predicted flap endonuclease-1-like 5' DNA nuclease
MNTSSNPAKSAGLLSLALGILLAAIALVFMNFNIADNFLSFDLGQTFWVGVFFMVLGLALWLVPLLATRRNVALMMITIGIVGVGVAAAYTYLNIANNFLTFNLTHIFWLGALYVVVGVILLLFFSGGEAQAPKVREQPKPTSSAASKTAPTPAAKTEKTTDTKIPKVDYAPRPAPDDLTLIEGVGPKVQEALNKAGVFTFAQVANMSGQELYQIVKVEQGVRIVGDAATWSKQAQYFVDGDMAGLKKYQAKLIGGREPEK